MRHRLAVLLLWLGVACSAAPSLPESGATPARDAPPRALPPTDGRHDGPAPRWIALRVRFGDHERTLGAWCREDVWTPLEGREPTSFVRSETWSRLGGRSARRIDSTRGAVWNGVLGRLRPVADRVDFVVEVGEGSVSPGPPQAWQDAEVELPRAEQRTYRFGGSTPPGTRADIARWGGLVVSLDDGSRTTRAAPSRRSFNHGFVAGDGSSAEYEVIVWRAAEPEETAFDGIVQAVFRLRPERSAAGFSGDRPYGGGIAVDG